MTLPGQNTLILTSAAIMRLLQERLNSDLSTGVAVVRVTDMHRDSYGTEFRFTVTTDPLPASDTITTTKE